MNIRILTTALAITVATTGLAPSNASADGHHHYKKSLKHIHKQQKHYAKHLRKESRHWDHHDDHHDWGGHKSWDHHGWGHDRVKIDYDYPDYDSERYGIYTTPGGGLGFFYSENEGPQFGYPYGRPYGYRSGFSIGF